MPAISGNVGAVFNGGTITDELVVNRSADATGGNLLELVAANVAAGSGTDLLVDAYGDVLLTASAGNSAVFRAMTNPATGQSDVSTNGYAFSDSNLALVGTVDARGVAALAHSGCGLITGRVTVPADGDLVAGECALWFDQTNGAAKLMVKAKSANGTVATGSLALT